MRLTYSEATEELRKLERDRKIFALAAVDGWTAWPILRTTIARRMCDINIATGRNKTAGRGVGEVTGIVWDGLRLLVRVGGMRDKLVTLTSSSEWRVPTNAGLGSIYFGELLDQEDLACIEHLNHPDALRNRGQKRLRPAGSLNFWLKISALYGRAFLPKRRFRLLSQKIKDALSETEERLDKDLVSEGEIEDLLRMFAGQYRVYRFLWWWIRPRALALTCYYGKEGLIAAAKTRGIPVIELQHGFISEGHFAYSYDSASMPSDVLMPFPDTFCAYGQFWIDGMNGLGYWTGRDVRVCGSIEIDRIRAMPDARAAGKKNKVMVTTQGIYERELTGFLEGVFGTVTANWIFVMRTHPLQDESFLREWIDRVASRFPHITLSLSSGADTGSTTNELIASTQWHASISSTCHMEALGIGVPTVVIPLPTSENMAILRGRAGAFFPGDVGEACEIFEETDVAPGDLDADYYFKADALDNLARVFKDGAETSGRPAL